MSTFHEEIAGRIERHLRDRQLVVLYDPRREFEPFIEEARSSAEDEGAIRIGTTRAWFGRYDGSYLALRRQMEDHLEHSTAPHGLVYVGGAERDRRRSPLMDFDLGGQTYEPQLRKLARDILRERYSDGQIDVLLAPSGVAYAEIAAYFDQESGDASMLRLLYGSVGSEEILSQWILLDDRDSELTHKGAVPELLALIQSRIGLVVSEPSALLTLRRDVVRYVLINEFRSDLGAPSPSALALIPEASSKEHRERIRAIAAELRRMDSIRYGSIADGVQDDLGLTRLDLNARTLGAIDTFRFEGQLLLEEAGRALATGDHEDALSLARGRADSHWVRTNPRRLAQWGALQQAAVLGQRVGACQVQLASIRKPHPAAWIEGYTAQNGWSTLDGLDRRLGAFLSAMDEDPVAGDGIRRVRSAYADWVRTLGEGFTNALVTAGWDAGWDLHQTSIFDAIIAPGPFPTAFFVIDAFRFEMGQELAERLGQSARVELRASVAALPTITPVGMAALLPGASESFSVREAPNGGGAAGTITDAVLPDWPARWRHLQARFRDAKELRLEELLHTPPEALGARLADARLILVRSQDIDAVGEAGVGLVAQQAMAAVIPNIARAVHRLGKAGIRRFVIAADHGHLLDASQEGDMKIEAPGGETVELHRRCWVGRGGRTPSGAVRASGTDLGYDTDLEFVFPAGRGVFVTGGGLRYHHGGASLQEMVIPALVISLESRSESPEATAKVKLLDLPERITNRTVGVRVELAPDLFAEPHWVRVVLLHQSEQVGEAGMAQGAALDPVTKRVQLIPGQPATVGLMLSRDDCGVVRLVVLDAETDAVLAQSKNLTVSLTI